jgi:predicted nucleic acid-binding protein
MKDRFFLDTNILVYVFDAKLPEKAKAAAALVRHAVDSGEGVISYQVVQEFLNVALRRFARPFSVAEAEQYLLTVLKPLLAVESSPTLYLEALRILARHQFSWYDSLIVAAALQAECSTLYTEDLQPGREVEGLRIRNPFV